MAVVDIFNTDKKYSIIYADPPWQFKNYNDKTATNWAGNHYSLMNMDAIKAMPTLFIADNACVLFMWATFPTLPQAFDVIKSWGFTYKTVAFNWIKQNKSGMGIFLGMGYWTRSNSEICLLATRGTPKRIGANVRQIMLSPKLEHSKKPTEARDRILRLVGDLPRIELFARQQIEGWDCWGNEV